MSILDALPLFDFMYIHTSNATFVSFITQKIQKLATKNPKKSKAITHSLDTAFLDMLVDISS